MNSNHESRLRRYQYHPSLDPKWLLSYQSYAFERHPANLTTADTLGLKVHNV